MRRPDGTVLRRLDTASARALLDEDAVCILRPVLHGALLDATGTDSVEFAAEAGGIRSDGTWRGPHAERYERRHRRSSRRRRWRGFCHSQTAASGRSTARVRADCWPFAAWRAMWSSILGGGRRSAVLRTGHRGWRRARERTRRLLVSLGSCRRLSTSTRRPDHRHTQRRALSTRRSAPSCPPHTPTTFDSTSCFERDPDRRLGLRTGHAPRRCRPSHVAARRTRRRAGARRCCRPRCGAARRGRRFVG
jgi:hypothetical protein